MSASSAPGRPAWSLLLGVGLVAASQLVAEIAWLRILSVTHAHVFAFAAVTSALLGGGIGAALAARGARHASWAALAIGPSYLVAHASVVVSGADPFGAFGAMAWARLALAQIALLLPFTLAGWVITDALKRHGPSAPRLYAADLFGAALGALLGLGLLDRFGPGTLASAGVLAGVGAGLLTARWRLAVPLVAALGLAGQSVPAPVADSKRTVTGEPFEAVLSDPARVRSTAWSSNARVDHVRFAPGVERAVIDGGVAAARIPTPRTRPEPSDVTLPYELRPDAEVLVIGSGAGWELWEAHRFGARSVLGVEVLADVAALTPAFVLAPPGVKQQVEDARGLVERAESKWDVIIMVHTITNAAAATGALALSEDHLLTVEAFRALHEHLTPDGLLLLTRPERQLKQILTLLEAAWSDPLGPRALAWRAREGGFYGAVLVGARPFSAEEIARVEDRVQARGLDLVHVPGRGPVPTDAFPAPTDDRPFFHRGGDGEARAGARLDLENLPLAERALTALLLEALLIGLVALALVAPRTGGRGGRMRRTLAFAASGLGFMLAEIALLHRLGLLVGHPTASAAISFGGLLAGAGLGSLAARGGRFVHRAGLAALACVGVAGFASPILRAALELGLVGRITVAGALSTGLGLALGGVLPAGLASSTAPEETARGFAANVLASVAGTGIALLLAPRVGLSLVAALAALAYGVAALGWVAPDRFALSERPPE